MERATLVQGDDDSNSERIFLNCVVSVLRRAITLELSSALIFRLTASFIIRTAL